MASLDNTMNISIKVHISLWDALKLRIAGSNIRQIIGDELEREKAEEESEIKGEEEGGGIPAEQLEKLNKDAFVSGITPVEAGSIRLNEKTGEVEICSEVYVSKVGLTKIWVNKDNDLIARTPGMCPRCGATFSLLDFKQMAVAVKGKETKNKKK